jgi:peptidoglycan/LPS O-acetylase OafA/YrhL
MGLYRLILAALVALTHAGVVIGGFSPGAVAVISFYLLSGFVMTLLIEKHYTNPGTIVRFYLDRAGRLFPQFIFYALLATICIYFLNIDSIQVMQMRHQLTLTKWALNMLMVPLAFYMYWSNGVLLLPQSWSLGLETTFYLVIPWILLYCSRRVIYLLAGGSLAIFLTAYLGIIDTDIYGYRLLPGTLFIFLIGWSFTRNDDGAKRFRGVMYFLAVILLVIAFMNQRLFALHPSKEVLAGLVIGILALELLKRFKFSRVDEFLGNLSYGVFLNHFIVLWLMRRFLGVKAFDLVNLAILLAVSCTFALLSYALIERPALRWRHKIRYRTKGTDAAASGKSGTDLICVRDPR